MKRTLLCIGLVLASLSSWSAPGAHGPNGEHLDQAAPVNASGLARLPDGSVNVPKIAQRRMGIRTLVASETEAAATLQLPGRVVQDPNASGRVQASYVGRIEPGPKGLPVPGQAVRQGEILAWLRYQSEPFAQAGQEAQRAELRASRQLAEQRLQRLKGLEGTVPRKEIEAARVDVESLSARERSIAASIQSREPLRAPVSGVIARSDLAAGQIVDARDVLVDIIDPSRLMVEAQTADVTLGERIGNASLAGQDGVKLQLAGVPRALRDGVLPLTFRAQADKPGQAAPLAVGQTVNVIVALRDKAKGIALPAEAVVRSPVNETVVWIKTGAERYTPQPVQVKPLDAKTVLVTRGLATDNRVVVLGAPLIAQIR
ncbi:MAG: efflux RND transporter periplasmic adaptor subunit [Roseateles sp.]|uniref:Multidrug efflux pump subunit AcrA (Membrane-fusion protein) n=1 Tax=Roseateles asaccharophilus TaxID=582607 RepID=A0ABU2AIE4_9BURK|nr:HlyD family efflux transporter periplasmic adaptor subunit [Roseateles asaccharophilus]MDR7336207.1 multidrug efflux pump subunit AcrA (membrane-fusion protein) [Roseateles asaccharophilus]